VRNPIDDLSSQFDHAAELIRLGDLQVPIAIRTAVSMDLPGQLQDGPLTALELADRLAVEPAPLSRLLEVLTEAGVLSRNASAAFALTDIGQVLRKDHPLSMRDAYPLAITELRAWSELEYSIRTGRSGFEHAYGEPHRSYRARVSEEDMRMDQAQKAATRVELLTLCRAYSWQNFRTIVDVGGGTGMFLAGLLQRFPNLNGIVFDLPRMIANAGTILQQYGVAGRCRMVGGDFFEAVPAGGDVYVMKAVLGGWDDAASIKILQTVSHAMSPDSRLLVIEPVMGAGPEFSRGNLVQLYTLVLYGGKDRAIEQYRALAAAAGLEVRAVIPRITLPIIEFARKRSEA
jgi:hypothetical protein